MLRDRPWTVTLGLVAAVAGHAALSIRWPALDIWSRLIQSEFDQVALYLGLAGVAAMAGGFAGVVIVFGLESQGERFLTFRTAGGRSLRSNWLSVIGSSFGSAGLAVGAALLDGLGGSSAGGWAFELSALLITHAILRMLGLLSSMMRVVAADDRKAAKQASRMSLDDLFGSEASEES